MPYIKSRLLGAAFFVAYKCFHWGILNKKGMIPVNLKKRKEINIRIQKYKQDVEKNLYSYASLTKDGLFAELSTTQAGLTGSEAEKRQSEFGKNIITTGNKNTTLHRLKEAIVNPCYSKNTLMSLT